MIPIKIRHQVYIILYTVFHDFICLCHLNTERELRDITDSQWNNFWFHYKNSFTAWKHDKVKITPFLRLIWQYVYILDALQTCTSSDTAFLLWIQFPPFTSPTLPFPLNLSLCTTCSHMFFVDFLLQNTVCHQSVMCWPNSQIQEAIRTLYRMATSTERHSVSRWWMKIIFHLFSPLMS